MENKTIKLILQTTEIKSYFAFCNFRAAKFSRKILISVKQIQALQIFNSN